MRTVWRFAGVLGIGFLLAAVATAKPTVHTFTGKVVGVLDGDTLLVLHDKTPVKVRLLGIDAPETGQAYGTAAKQHASQLAFGKNVTVKYTEEDKYGRILAYVYVDGARYDDELLRLGYARLLVIPPNGSHARAMLLAELDARAHGRGLWGAC